MAGGRISDEDVQKVREATDIVALIGERTQLKQRGREFWCCCPLHHEKTPSFKIDPASQLWHCFGCDEGGDAFGFVMKADDLSFPEAVRKLAERAHIEITQGEWDGQSRNKRQRLKEVCRETAEFYHTQLMRSKAEDAAAARSYLGSRKLGGDIPKKWNLGFAPGRGALVRYLTANGFTATEMMDANVAVRGRDGKTQDRFYNRVMFPISDVQGECIAFGGRIIGKGEPKYLNSQETPIFHKSQVLYGLDKAKSKMASTGTAIVAEGYTDVIALHEAGIENSVATLGTALTRNHLRLLARHAGRRIIYLFDGDAAGQRATERALQFIDESITPESGRPMELLALTLPGGMDPAEYIDAHGSDAMREILEQAEPLILFGIKRRISKHSLASAEGRAAALTDALDVLAPIKDSILAKDYASQIASTLRFREADVMDALAKLKKPRTYQNEADQNAHGQSEVPEKSREQERHLSIAERNRLNLELELLGTAAKNPLETIALANEIERVRWHRQVHLELANSILSTLMESLDATPAQVIEAAAKAVPEAPSLLTRADGDPDEAAGTKLRFLVEELLIGDMVEDIEEHKARLALVSPSDEKARQDGFDALVLMQERLNEMKKTHKTMQ